MTECQESALVLGVDMGTSKIAAVLYDPVQECVVHITSAPVPAMLAPSAVPAKFCASGVPGEASEGAPALWDADAMLTTTAEAVRALPAALRARVGAVGASTQMHGVVVLAEGRPATPFANWQDRACARTFLKRLRATTHRPALAQGHGGTTLARWAVSGALPAENATTAVATTIADFFCAALCGDDLRPAIDPTNAQAWGMAVAPSSGDDESGSSCGWRWDKEALEAAGVPVEVMPEIVASGTVLGRSGGAFAVDACGLPAGAAVCVAVGDFQAALHATLCAHPEARLSANIGTSAQLAVLVPRDDPIVVAPSSGSEAAESIRSYEVRPYVDAQHCVVTAAALMGGSAWQAFVDTVRAWQTQLCADSTQVESRDALQARLVAAGVRALEAEEDKAETMPCIDARFGGERHAPDARGAATGLTATNARDLGALAAALVLGIVRNLRDMLPPAVLACCSSNGSSVVVGSGNAVRRSPLFRTAIERVLGMPCVVTPFTEEAATGAAMLAAHALVR